MYSSLYTENTFRSLDISYPDKTVTVKTRPFYTEQSIDLLFSHALSGANDVKLNNFSIFYLSNRKKLGDILSVKALTKVQRIYSSFFAFNAINGTDTESKYWRYDTDQYGEAGRVCKIQSDVKIPNNENFFEIIFLDEILCQIKHNNRNVDFYLTLDSTTNLSFQPEFDVLKGRPTSPQVFFYVYDDANDFIVLYKKVLDFPYYVTFSNLGGGRLALKQPPLGPENTFPLESVIKLRSAVSPDDEYPLDEFHAKYKKNYKINTLDTDEDAVRVGIKNNYIINTEYSNITGKEVVINLLTLKNELAPQNNNADFDPYILADDFTFRDYNKIFTGTNQVYGSESMILSYDGFTSKVEFKPGSISYFHVPHDTFPYERLNINDTNIASKGAIAGDHPLVADKIFKKRAGYKNYTYFGDSTDETNGVFLCSWLSGSSNVNTAPVWVDRYYNPQQTTFFDALCTMYPANSTYVSDFNNITAHLTGNPIVFDARSNLYLEKGVYYAYHHIGNKDLHRYVGLYDSNLIQKNLVNYYVKNSQLLTTDNKLLEYSFNGEQYSQTDTLTGIYAKSNSFTLTFDLNVDNWQRSFGYQIVGNYVDSGIGIFNQTYITPYLLIPQNNVLHVFNHRGTELNRVVFEADVVGLFRKEELENYYTLLSNGKIYKLNSNHTIISQANTNIIPFEYVTGTFYNSHSACFVVDSISAKKVLGFDFNKENFFEPNASQITTLGNIPISSVNSSVIYNNRFYCTSAYLTRLSGSDLYYKESDFEIRKWSLSRNSDFPFLSASIPIQSFNIDRFGNFYIAQHNKLTKLNNTRQTILTADITDEFYENIDIDFSGEFNALDYDYCTYITSRPIAFNGVNTNSRGIKINKYDSNGLKLDEFILADLTSPITVTNLTNGDYLRREIAPTHTDNSLTLRAKLPGILGTNKQLLSVTAPLDKIDHGAHNIAVRFDNIQGRMSLFIDGTEFGHTDFTPGQYAKTTSLINPFTIGSSQFFNNQTLSQYLGDLYFYVIGTKIGDFRIYDVPLDDKTIMAVANLKNSGNTMYVNLPSGKRQLNDEVERIFKLDVPENKAAQLKISLVNSSITNYKLKQLLQKRITDRITSIIPYNVKLNNINWID